MNQLGEEGYYIATLVKAVPFGWLVRYRFDTLDGIPLQAGWTSWRPTERMGENRARRWQHRKIAANKRRLESRELWPWKEHRVKPVSQGDMSHLGDQERRT